MPTRLHAGTAEISITPAPGCDMIHRRAEAIHDDLWARAMVFACGSDRAAIVGLDLISLSREQISRIRDRVRQLCGLGPESLLLCCSHTHSGPVTSCFRGWGQPDHDYIRRLIENVARVVETGFQSLAPCRLSYGESPLQVGFNRRVDNDRGVAEMAANPAVPADAAVRVLCVNDAGSGRIRGVLFSHGCHPVVIHSGTRMVSSDYPGRAAEFLKAELGPDVCPVFAQGCGGDANSSVLNGTFADREWIGVAAGRAALAAVESAEPIEGVSLKSASRVVTLPARIPTVDEATAALALQEQELNRLLQADADPGFVAEFREFGLEWARDLCRIAVAPGASLGIDMDISAVAFGDRFCILGLGAEPFYAYQALCRAASPWPNTLVLGCVNGPVCYLPPAAEFPRQGYEIASTSYEAVFRFAYKVYGTLALAPECEDAVLRGVRAMLDGLRRRV